MRSIWLIAIVAAGFCACTEKPDVARPPALPPAAVASAPAIAPSSPGLTAADVNAALRTEWSKRGIAPSAPADDARFFRRLYIDIVGVIPPPDAVRAFLADTAPDKRARATDTLLATPRYVERWADYWESVLFGPPDDKAGVNRIAFHSWMATEIRKHVGYDHIVYDLITATGDNVEKPAAPPSPPPMIADAGAPDGMSMSTDAGPPIEFNGAVNYLLNYAQAPEDLSGAVSRIFLGVQIQCAQCHDHKTEKWRQTDFQRFTACFAKTRALPLIKQGVAELEVKDTDQPVPMMHLGTKKMTGPSPYMAAQPVALDGTDFSTRPNRRQALAAWMTAPENPWFARALVNRMWSHFLGSGFVEPIDDFRESNPPLMADLFQKIADDFRAHGYDIERLVRLITSTEAYALSSAQAAQTDKGKLSESVGSVWSRYPLKPLGPDELVESLVAATNLEPVLERVAGQNMARLKQDFHRRMTFLFDVDEDARDTHFSGTIPQALMMLNGRLANSGVSAIPGAALAQILGTLDEDKDKVTTLYLRTLSRFPTDAELARAIAFVNAPNRLVTDPGAPPPPPVRGGDKPKPEGTLKPKPPTRVFGPGNADGALGQLKPRFATPREQAYEDLFWALINSSEFYFNH